MARVKAERISEASERIVGSEPMFTPDKELTRLELIVALNWYNAMRDSKQAKKYLLDALKQAEVDKKKIAAFTDIADVDCRTVGYLARMVSRGAKLSEIDQAQFENGLTGLMAAAESIAEGKKEEEDADGGSVQKPQVSVQDRIRAQADKVICELEWDLDQKHFDGNTKTLLVDAGVKGPQAKHIAAWVEKNKKVFVLASRSKDEQIKEGYSNYSKKDVKNILKWLEACRE
jgi:hypothetical protein